MAEEVTKELVKTMSTVMKARQEDGSFIPVFPVVTANEVYVDIDNGVKLSSYLNSMSAASRSVENLDAMFALTYNDVKLNECIRTIDEGRYFVVVNVNSLNSPEGYLEILTANRIGGPNGLVTFDENGNIPNVHPSAEFITYSR